MSGIPISTANIDTKRIPIRRHNPNPTLTADGQPGKLACQVERLDASELNQASASRIWGLPNLGTLNTNGASANANANGSSSLGYSNGLGLGTTSQEKRQPCPYQISRQERRRLRELQRQQQPPDNSNGGLSAPVYSIMSSVNGRRLDYNAADRIFRMTPTDRKIFERVPAKVSAVSMMRAQLEETELFNENLKAQLNNRNLAIAPNQQQPSCPCAKGGQQTGQQQGVVIPDSSISSLTSQLVEDKIQGDKIRNRLTLVQATERLKERQRQRRSMEVNAIHPPVGSGNKGNLIACSA